MFGTSRSGLAYSDNVRQRLLCGHHPLVGATKVRRQNTRRSPFFERGDHGRDRARPSTISADQGSANLTVCLVRRF